MQGIYYQRKGIYLKIYKIKRQYKTCSYTDIQSVKCMLTCEQSMCVKLMQQSHGEDYILVLKASGNSLMW